MVGKRVKKWVKKKKTTTVIRYETVCRWRKTFSLTQSKIWATCDRNMPGKCLVLKEITERDGTYMIHDIAKDRIIPSSLVHFILKRILKVCICFIETPLFRHHMKLLIMKLWRVQQAWADLNFLEHNYRKYAFGPPLHRLQTQIIPWPLLPRKKKSGSAHAQFNCLLWTISCKRGCWFLLK